MILLACLAFLVALGLLERFAARRARAAVPIRIHVNGTRGKSTVTRLVAAALREAGITTLGKVTGTAPRLILPDGSEQPIVRRAPANIREQAWLLRKARRAGARALVAECMAVRPDLQRASEREMLRATIGVITNARLDHTEAQGRTAEEIAQSLANTIPRAAVLVIGDPRFVDLFAARCAPLGTRVVVAEQRLAGAAARGRPAPESVASGMRTWDPASAGLRSSGEGRVAGWLEDDIAIALAVTREVGISDEVALSGMTKAAPDPGAVASGVWNAAGQDVEWVDATAANDPESLDMLARELSPSLIVYNHRGDRPERLRTFARVSATFRGAATIVLTGDRPSLTLAASVRRARPDVTVRFVPPRRLPAAIGDIAAGNPDARVVFCGNTRGFVRPVGSVNS